MFKGIFFFLKLFAKNGKKYLVLKPSVQIISIALSAVNILLPGMIIDQLVQQKDAEVIIATVACLVLSNLIGNVLINVFNTRCNLYQTQVFQAFQVQLAEKISHADLEQLESNDYLEMKERATKFLYANGRGFASILNDAFEIISKLCSFIVIISIIATFNPLVILLLILMVAITTVVDTRAKRASYKMDLEKTPYERRGAYYIDILSKYEYGKEVRTYNLFGWLTKKYKQQLEHTFLFYKKSGEKICVSRVINEVFNFIQAAIVYAYLIVQVWFGSITIGSFTIYLNAINSFSGSMKSIMDSITNIYTFKPYYDAVVQFFNIPTHSSNGGQKLIQKSTYTIEFRSVSFRYAGTQNWALKDINLTIIPGKKYSIVGENGAGKTTFIKLLTRMYSPTEGEILLNGVNIEDYDYDEYMSVFSSVFQDFKLFSFTVKENIALTECENVRDETICEIIDQMGLSERMRSLEKGIYTNIYKTFSEDHCFEPSGGEAQKIAMARAIFKNSPIMILDEPTSALDPRAENDLYEKFSALTKDKTTFFISHRLTSCRLSDVILVFQGGQIAEQGSHDELLSGNTLYRELFMMQSKYFVEK